jgi:hypothetical protein
MMTSNPPFQDWAAVLGSGRLAGAVPDRLIRHVHVLEMNVASCASHKASASKQLDQSLIPTYSENAR